MKKSRKRKNRVVLQSLNDCARVFLRSSDFKESSLVVYETCKEMIGAGAGHAALLAAGESEMELLFLDTGSLSCELDAGLPKSVRGLRAVAQETGRAVFENDFRNSRWQQYLPPRHVPLENVLFAPLILDNNVVGLFVFANKPGGFTHDDVLVVQSFADLAAVGLMKNRALKNLEGNVKQLSALTQTANDAIITVDREGIIRFWNRAAEKCFGYSAGEIIGKSCSCLVPEEYAAAHEKGFARMAETGVSRLAGRRVEVDGLRKDGGIVPVELSISTWEVEEDVYFSGIVRDISRRKQMESRLEMSARRLREIFQLMRGGGGIYKAIDDGEDFLVVEFHRPAGLDGIDIPEDRIRGRRFLEIFPESRDYGLFDVFRRVWRTGKPEFHPVTIYDGAEIRSWRKNYVYKLSSGEIVALYEDITDRKRMEKALLESENLFRSIFETSPDPISLSRLEDGKFVLVNQKFLELTDFSRDEVIGSTALEINIWNDLERRNAFFSQLIEEWQVNDFEAEFRRRDGELITALLSASLLSYQNHPHILAVTRDITRLKKTELALLDAHAELEKRYEVSTEKLKESEIKYSTLVDALLTGIYMCDGEKIVFVNEQFITMFGYEKDELLGMNITELIHPEDRENVGFMHTFPESEDGSDDEYEIRGVRKDGEAIFLSGRKTAVKFNSGLAILGNVADVTIRKEADKELQKSE
jgi:PAS domain S-box-containing protein